MREVRLFRTEVGQPRPRVANAREGFEMLQEILAARWPRGPAPSSFGHRGNGGSTKCETDVAVVDLGRRVE